ncbi:unnamed protein product [Brassica oleracea var. botrytis]
MLSTVSAIKEQMLLVEISQKIMKPSCLLGLSTQKTLIQNRDFLHYNHLPGIVAEVLAQHFPDLQPSTTSHVNHQPKPNQRTIKCVRKHIKRLEGLNAKS